MLENSCEIIDMKIAGQMAIQRKELDQHGYNKFINIQQELMTYTKDIGNFEDKIELIRETVTTEILKCPEKEEVIRSVYEPRMEYFENKRKEKVNTNTYNTVSPI